MSLDKHMILRNFEIDDVESIVRNGNNFNVSKYLTSKFPHPYRKKDAEWWISVGSKNGLNKAIDLNGKCIGGVGAFWGEYEHAHSAQIGYWIGERYWGNGFATQALSLLTSEIFSAGKIIRLAAPVFGPNKASMRVLDKCGYKLEGILKKAVFKNNEFMDEHIFTKLNS